MKSKFQVRGLDCVNCAAEVERAIQKIDGVENVSISFMPQKMELEYDETRKDEIMKKIKKVIKREEPDMEIEEF